jgi:hypothetical protein
MIVVFLGPTLPHDDARRVLDAQYSGPAAQGDVYRAVRRGARAIGLVDGFFHNVPSVWHKEILWAISEGVPVYGSASMGALRAAELSTFGMIGVGHVFESYRDGVLADDDEVALAHAGPEHDYRAASEPMVDIRATVRLALENAIIDSETASALVQAAKRLHYVDRIYPAIVEQAARLTESGKLTGFAEWWPENRVRLKRNDAVAMLRRIADDDATGTKPPAPGFWFERTALWDEVAREAADWDGRTRTASGEAREHAAAVAAELSETVRDAVLARVLALDEARRQQFQIDDERLYHAVVELRRRRSLLEPEDLFRWMEEHGLDKSGFLRLAADEARIAWVREVLQREIDAMMPDYLRSTGQYRTAR